MPNSPDPPRLARLARIVVPLALIAISLWALVGCLYIPTGDNIHLSGTKKDFREMVGVIGSHRPIIAGAIGRDRIEQLLGRPPFESDDRSRAMYVLHVKSNIIIFPACFTATDAEDTGIALLLAYDSDGRLSDWNRIEVPGGFDPINGPYGIPAGQAVQDRIDDELLFKANQSSTTKASDQSPQASRWRIKPVKQ